MEVVTIEGRTFSYVCERFMEFAKRIESLCSTHTQKVENWLDSQEVCLLLGFSKRTLQYYRSNGRLSYSQIEMCIRDSYMTDVFLDLGFELVYFQ